MTDLDLRSADSRTQAPRRWAALVVLSASLLVIVIDMTILNIALPEMAADLRPSGTQQLWIVDSYSLVLAGLLVSWAAIGDRWGRKRMLMLGYTIFAVASLLVLVADSAAEVIAIRVFLGVGGAMIMPTTLSLIRVLFTDARERATALSIWAAVSGLGAAVGPLVGGVLLEHFSWHAAFLINVPLMVAGVIAGWILLPESRVANAGRWDALGAVLSMLGMTALVWAIKHFGERASLAVPEAWLALVIGGAAMAWFVRRCLRSPAPLLDLGLFRSRPFTAGIIAALGSMFAMIAAMLLVAQWLQLVAGVSPVQAGLLLLPTAVASAVASLAAAPLARYVGARGVLAGGIGLTAVGMVVLAVFDLSIGSTVVALCFVGVGAGSLALGSAMIMSSSPEDKAGNAGALEESSYELGGTLGVAVLGSISALVYRSALQAPLPAEVLTPARESLGAAVEIARQGDVPGLAEAAGRAFSDSLQMTGWIGAAVLVLVAVAVFALTPKGTDAVGH